MLYVQVTQSRVVTKNTIRFQILVRLLQEEVPVVVELVKTGDPDALVRGRIVVGIDEIVVVDRRTAGRYHTRRDDRMTVPGTAEVIDDPEIGA